MIWEDIKRIRIESPLIHNITNYVVMNTTANALLAIGASPVMAHAPEEVEQMARQARALVINIGTLSSSWVESMLKAGVAARRSAIPIVFDPVGCGATQFRMNSARMLVQEIHPTIIRGNASEIRSLVREILGGKGVDSYHSPEEVLDDARELSRFADCVVSVSGPVDVIVQGDEVKKISKGHPMMSKVTGMGCTASAITGAFAAVNPVPLIAASNAMTLMGIVGELAAGRSAGPGSFQMHFFDVLNGIQESDIQ